MYEFHNKQCPGSLILSKHQHPVPNLIRSSFLPTGSTSPCNEGVIHTHEMAQEPPCPPTWQWNGGGRTSWETSESEHATCDSFIYIYIYFFWEKQHNVISYICTHMNRTQTQRRYVWVLSRGTSISTCLSTPWSPDMNWFNNPSTSRDQFYVTVTFQPFAGCVAQHWRVR